MIQSTSIPTSFRPFHDADRLDVAAVWRDSWMSIGIPLGRCLSLTEYEARLAGQGRDWTIHVAVVSERAVGFVAFQPQERWLRQLFVAPAHQGIGLGTALLNVAKREMPEGFWLRTDAANASARRFYEAAGLTLGSLGPHPVHGQPVSTYEWKLARSGIGA